MGRHVEQHEGGSVFAAKHSFGLVPQSACWADLAWRAYDLGFFSTGLWSAAGLNCTGGRNCFRHFGLGFGRIGFGRIGFGSIGFSRIGAHCLHRCHLEGGTVFRTTRHVCCECPMASRAHHMELRFGFAGTIACGLLLCGSA